MEGKKLMALDVLLVKEKGGRLAPADSISFESISAIGNGEYLTAKLTRPRNVKHHRKFFALLKIVFEAQDRYPTTNHLLHAIKIGVKHYDLVHLTKNHTVIETRSISFASMAQDEFEEFYDKVVNLIVTQILPGVDSAELERQVLDIIGE